MRPPPREMYWKFTDDDQLLGQYENETNRDKLTYSVSVEYGMTINRRDNGRKLRCHYVTPSGDTFFSSEEVTVRVLCKGQVVILF